MNWVKGFAVALLLLGWLAGPAIGVGLWTGSVDWAFCALIIAWLVAAGTAWLANEEFE